MSRFCVQPNICDSAYYTHCKGAKCACSSLFMLFDASRLASCTVFLVPGSSLAKQSHIIVPVFAFFLLFSQNTGALLAVVRSSFSLLMCMLFDFYDG